MIRVVVTGSECTGKTTLAEALAEHYGAPWTAEYARLWVEQNDRAPGRDDVRAIADGQLALEESAAAAAPALLIHDTDLLSTVVYSRHYYGVCPPAVERAFARASAPAVATLYLLAGIDVPWAANGQMRDRGDRRQEMHDLFRQELTARQLPFTELRGSRSRRLREAVAAIDPLLLASQTDK